MNIGGTTSEMSTVYREEASSIHQIGSGKKILDWVDCSQE